MGTASVYHRLLHAESEISRYISPEVHPSIGVVTVSVKPRCGSDALSFFGSAVPTYASYILAVVVRGRLYGFLAAVYDKRVARKFKRKLRRQAVLASSAFLVPEKEGAKLDRRTKEQLPSAHYLARYKWLSYNCLLLYVESRPLLSFGWSLFLFYLFLAYLASGLRKV
ncbi:hypothetical protein EDB85DRAFT_905996 [Lactarius pseudohatsudake]|nr:hypothetical protein EDB85DRAFT_905996 [Lactarius pseudohatsudake]